MFGFIKTRWKLIANDLVGSWRYWYTSPSKYLLHRGLRQTISAYAHGQVIDLGAGAMVYRPFLERAADSYHSLDYGQTEEKYNKGDRQLDFTGDIQDPPLADQSYDTAFCTQVLEHVPDPGKAIAAMARILRPGGQAIISVPHLAYLHNEPYDYFRFTRHGLTHLCQTAGLTVIEIRELGGLFSFIGYIRSTILLSLAYRLPLVWDIVFFINLGWSLLDAALDRLTGNARLFCLNYVLVARKQ